MKIILGGNFSKLFRSKKGNVPLYFSIVITKLDDVKIILGGNFTKLQISWCPIKILETLEIVLFDVIKSVYLYSVFEKHWSKRPAIFLHYTEAVNLIFGCQMGKKLLFFPLFHYLDETYHACRVILWAPKWQKLWILF